MDDEMMMDNASRMLGWAGKEGTREGWMDV